MCLIYTGLKASKSKISPHKHNTEQERYTVNKTKTSSPEGSVGENLQAKVKITTPDDKPEKSKAAHDTSHGNEDKYSTSTTGIKSILKRTNEDQSVNDQQSIAEESLPADSLDHRKATTSSIATTDSNTEMFDIDDTEQPFASLTDEEKKIIGLTACLPSGNSDSAAIKSIDLKSPVSDLSTISSAHSNTSVLTKSFENNTGDGGVMSSNQGDVDTTDAHKAVKVEQVEIGSLQNERMTDVNAKAVDEIDEMSADSGHDCISKKRDLTVTDEKSDKFDKSRKRKSVQLQISDKGSQDKTPLIDVIATKKRKSQQLPCIGKRSNDTDAVKSGEESSKAIKMNESCIDQETTLRQLFMSASKSLKDTEHSRKEMPKSISPLKRHKAVFDSPSKLKEKSPIKNLTKEIVHVPKKKVIVSETQINFFGPSKKAKEIDKAETPKKNKEKTTPVKTLKASKVERRGLEKNKSLQKTETKTHMPITILSSDDSDMGSPDNWESSTEEHNSLKKIWDDFELPQSDNIELEEDLQSPVKKQTQELPRARMPSTSKDTGKEKQPSLVNTLGLGKKQRIAHTSSQVSYSK